jgi:hypothetical protein
MHEIIINPTKSCEPPNFGLCSLSSDGKCSKETETLNGSILFAWNMQYGHGKVYTV